MIEEAKMFQKFAEDKLIEIDKTEQNKRIKDLELNKKQNEEILQREIDQYIEYNVNMGEQTRKEQGVIE